MKKMPLKMKDCFKDYFFIEKAVIHITIELKKTIILELFFQFEKTVLKNTLFGRGSIRADCFFFNSGPFFCR